MMVRPPAVAASLLAACLPPSLRDPVLGDLEERFGEHAGGRPAAARRWYRRQVARSLWPAVTASVGGRGLLRLCAALLVGFAVLWSVGNVSLFVTRSAWVLVFSTPPRAEAASLATYIAALLPAVALAGWSSARVGGPVGALAVLSASFLLVLPVLLSPLVGHGGDPLWARLAWICLAPPAAIGPALAYLRERDRGASGTP